MWQSSQVPQPPWHGPAMADAFRNMIGIPGMREYDRAIGVAAIGGRLYLGSNADDSVRCLDVATGKELWCFTADGPVRMAPTSPPDGSTSVATTDTPTAFKRPTASSSGRSAPPGKTVASSATAE